MSRRESARERERESARERDRERAHLLQGLSFLASGGGRLVANSLRQDLKAGNKKLFQKEKG